MKRAIVGTGIYGLFILAGIAFYVVLKGAAGHGFVFYWYEILSFIILILSPVSIFSLIMVKSDKAKKVMKIAGTLLSSLVLLLAIVASVYMFTFKYGSDVNPIALYILIASFLGLSTYELYVVLSYKLIRDESTSASGSL